jgi:HipA-like protein
MVVIKNILKALLPDFFNTSNLSEKTNRAVFVLTYKNKIIGFLEYKDKKWLFRYSENFKKNNFINPLLDFPLIDKEYQFTALPPFFAARIPSINQPFHKKKLLKYKGNVNDIVSLLEIFGVKSINNPFELKKQEDTLISDFN